MRVLSLFDGMSCGQIAFKELGINVDQYNAYEIDKYAIAVTQHNFPNTIQGGDVFKADFKQYEGKIDWLVGGSPCFAAGTSVLTMDGYKNIEDVKVGDMVLTHRLRWRKVTAIGHQKGETYGMESCSMLNTVVTANHPYYTRDRYEVCKPETRGMVKALHDPMWTEVGKMEKGKTNIGIPVLPGFDQSPFTEEDCWIIGRYLADGHVRISKRKGRKNSYQYQMILSVGNAKVEDTLAHIKSHNVSCFRHTKSTYRIVFSSQRWCEFVKNIGLGGHAHEKRIPVELLVLPVEKLKALVDGYVSGDGCIVNDNTVVCTTVSRELALGLQLAIARIYGLNASVSAQKLRAEQYIEGRRVHCRQAYTVSWHPRRASSTQGMLVDGIVWVPFRSVTPMGENTVYNLTVEEDNSYTANNAIVHNCTYWSIAQTKNRETTASGLGWELFSQYVRALHEAKPKYFLYENNASMSEDIRYQIASTFGFEQIEINSALVSAQNRRRFYWVGVRQEDGSYLKAVIRQPEDRKILLRDILETSAREKAYHLCSPERSYALTTKCSMATPENTLLHHQHTMIAEAKDVLCFAERGRYLEDGQIEQQIEIREDGKTNTLATVSKDNSLLVVNGSAEPVNTVEEKAHTLKAQYYKNGVANFISNPGFDATAVAERAEDYEYAELSDEYLHGMDDTNVFGKIICQNSSDNNGQPAQGTRVYKTESKSICLDGDSRKFIIQEQPVRIGTIESGEKSLNSDSQANRVYSIDGKSVTVGASGGRAGAKSGLYACPTMKVPEATKQGFSEIKPGEYVDLEHIASPTRRGGRMVEKSNCLATSNEFYEYCGTKKHPIYSVKDGMITIKGKEYPVKLRDGSYIIRKLTVGECMRLQTVPSWYDFSAISKSQAYKCLGNGWTVEVIMHLIRSALENGVEQKEQWLFDF